MTHVRVDRQPLAPGHCIVGNTGFGVLGSAVPATGPAGRAPFGYADLEPGDLGAEVMWTLLTRPEAGTLEVLEDSSFRFSGAPPGTYHFYVLPRRAGRVLKPKLVAITVGPASQAVNVTLSLT
jgi:hypothetical protein